jgi:hypothetical protein
MRRLIAAGLVGAAALAGCNSSASSSGPCVDRMEATNAIAEIRHEVAIGDWATAADVAERAAAMFDSINPAEARDLRDAAKDLRDAERDENRKDFEGVSFDDKFASVAISRATSDSDASDFC